MRRARVFISCGQWNDREIAIGRSVQRYLSERFDTYFAERVHSSDALTTNIFRALRNSEYFVFIDFKRDKISNEQYRGSLFVNQEIAIATFLGLSGAGFCEKYVKREGILQHHIYNASEFEDGTQIINQLQEITGNWDPTSVNELEIQKGGSPMKGVRLDNHPEKPLTDWYHLTIKNNSKTKHAFSVHGYVTRIMNLDKGKELQIPTNELIWSGLGEISSNIVSGTSRDLDAFFLMQGQNKIRFHQRPLSTNNPNYLVPNLQTGKYVLHYTVISSNFETVSKEFRLEFGGSPNIIFEELKDSV